MMNEDAQHFLVECISDINILLKKPLQQTLRIKFTAFNVSANYLVFGATSGGIYVFDRDKLNFLKLVPSKEGGILKLLICPEEKYVVVATARGCVILVENSFTDLPIKYQLFNEHNGNTITDIIWHYNEIYCGDNKGRVSVILLSSLFSKAIFQTPTAILMHLDSPIVQLDACGKFLLVSTKSKTYLCDTEVEQYRQIGKKLRDGDFGSCFAVENPGLFAKNTEREKSRFKFLKDDEALPMSTVPSNASARIYCARPGFRLWEANMSGAVLCTYQLKSTLHEHAAESVCVDSDVNCRLKFRKMSLNQFENFGRLVVVREQFLLTYSRNNLVILDQQGINVLFVYEMRDLFDVKVLNNYLYLWNRKDVRVLALMDLELLLLKALSAKQYVLSSELCLKYNQRVLQLVETSDALRALHVLKDKCKQEETRALAALFAAIEERERSERDETGGQIVTVALPSCSYNPATARGKPRRRAIPSASNAVHPSIEIKTTEPTDDPHYVNNILYKQYQVNQLYDNIETAQLNDLLSSRKNPDEIVALFEHFLQHVHDNALEKDNNNVRSWCHKQYLKYINGNRDCLAALTADSTSLKALVEALNSLTTNAQTKCACGFPLPLPDANDEYFCLAQDVYKKLSSEDKELLLSRFPRLWKMKLHEMPDKSDKNALIIQLSDFKLFKEQSEVFSLDGWNDCTWLLVKLRRGRCLNCDNTIDPRAAMAWRDYALIMLKRIGGLQTTKVLQKYAKFIPNSELGYEFYQSCLFSAVSKENGKSCDFMANVLTSARLENHFEDGLRAYLNQKHLGKPGFGAAADSPSDRIGTKCPVCHLLINNAILDVSTQLGCGHTFHKLCLESVNGICSMCMRVPI